jgi:hypothetical protein
VKRTLSGRPAPLGDLGATAGEHDLNQRATDVIADPRHVGGIHPLKELPDHGRLGRSRWAAIRASPHPRPRPQRQAVPSGDPDA